MTMDCMLETQDLAMNGGTPSGALYSHRTVYVCHERGRQWEIILGNDQSHWKLLSTLEQMLGRLSHQFNFLCMFHVYLQSRMNTLRYVQWLQWRESLYYWSVEQGGNGMKVA
jgi:hypothetical protein